jgi:hypothetical protein
MGYKKNIISTIDWLAKNGIMFSNAFANGPYTPYSVPSFLASNIPPVPKRMDNIAQILKSNGYATAAFEFFRESLFSPSSRGLIAKSGWHLGYRSDNYKLIINKSEFEKPRLYDHKKHPEERSNIYNKNKKLRDKLESEMMALL